MGKLIVGNLKANILSSQEREIYISSFKKILAQKKMKDLKIVLCPPFVHLEYFAKNIKSQSVKIGAQNAFWEGSGSFTGEITPAMIKGVHGEFVIVGHSERRRYFHETDEIANAKMRLIFKSGLRPIYCIGESREERNNGETKQVITRQIQEGLKGLSPVNLEKIIFAYEPVWAVGTDVVPSSNDILEVKILIKKIIVEMYGIKEVEKIIILYGGSVKAKTVKQVCLDPKMHGVLVGRESLNPSEFLKIAEIISFNNHE